MEGVGIPWSPPSKEQVIVRSKLLSLFATNVQDDEGVKDLLKKGNCAPRVLQKEQVTCDATLFFDEELGYYFFTFNNKEAGEVITLKSYIEHLQSYSWREETSFLSNPKEAFTVLLQLLESRQLDVPKLYFLVNCLRGEGLADKFISEVLNNPIGHADEQGFVILKECCCDVGQVGEPLEEHCNGIHHYIAMSSILGKCASADSHTFSSKAVHDGDINGTKDEARSSLTSMPKRIPRYARKFLHVPPNYKFV